ncbi:MAG: magnesium/cobalt transporter CorA [Phycisphaerae bacterium]|nr:magnesium/cobalt transporter CorA [Phycisphaerae bacterium]
MSAKSRRHHGRRARDLARRPKPGTPPGTLHPPPKAPPSEVSVLAFGPAGHDEVPLPARADLARLPALLEKWPVTWVNVEGLGDADVLAELGRIFNLHHLALEDVLHPHQRPKAERYDDSYFIVARMPVREQPWRTEQVSIFLGPRYVLTFQEGPRGDPLDPIRERIRSGALGNRARPDYLVHAILDAIVDHYFPLLEQCGERLDALEEMEAGVTRPVPALMSGVHAVKRDLLTIRRIVWPLRDALNALLRDPTPLITDETRMYLRDLQDHTIQIVDLVETYRDIASGITEVYLSSVSQHTNEIMKVLTIIATIFIPLTFIVGVYGMNFDSSASPLNMPELRWYYGYPLLWLLMLLIATAMLLLFRRYGWLGGGREQPPGE